jgi:phosphoribosylanthranilate isomerase
MHVKICGLTNVDDALAAIDAGADYLGFNFYPKSPRCITPEDCARLQSAIRHSPSAALNSQLPITTVGIFVNESPARIAALLDRCGLDLAQLHGDESPGQLAALRGRVFKAFRGAAEGADYAAFAQISPGAPALLIDGHAPHGYGGTGRVADWSAARLVAAQFPIFLAGGLTPDNVADAVAQVRPWGVDVASGVESAPGRKDHARVRAFAQAAHRAAETHARTHTESA